MWPTPTLLPHNQHIYLGSCYSRHTSTNGLDSKLPPVMDQMGWLAISFPPHYIYTCYHQPTENLTVYDSWFTVIKRTITKRFYRSLLSPNVLSWLQTLPLVCSKYTPQPCTTKLRTLTSPEENLHGLWWLA